MKHISLLVFIVMFSAYTASAQLQFVNADDTVEYNPSVFEGPAYAPVTNTGTDSINAWVRVVDWTLADGHKFKICWNANCYDTMVAAPQLGPGIMAPAVAPGQTTTKEGGVIGYIEPNGAEGISTMQVVIFDNNNQLSPGDTVEFTFVFDNDVVGAPDRSVRSAPGLRSAYPNPADNRLVVEVANLENQADAQLVLINAVGQRVLSQAAPAVVSGEVVLNTSTLPDGLYFLQLRSDRDMLSSQRVFVRH